MQSQRQGTWPVISLTNSC